MDTSRPLVEYNQYYIREVTIFDPAPLTCSTLWLFTDGGSHGNGSQNCKSSWGCYLTDGCTVLGASGVVADKEIPNVIYKSSNNRGELTALHNGLYFIIQHIDKFSFDDIKVISDSMYAIGCLDKWSAEWFSNPVKHNLSKKKNLDIIKPAKALLDSIRGKYILEFQHVNSHKPAPSDTESERWFIWKCNNIVDELCSMVLSHNN